MYGGYMPKYHVDNIIILIIHIICKQRGVLTYQHISIHNIIFKLLH